MACFVGCRCFPISRYKLIKAKASLADTTNKTWAHRWWLDFKLLCLSIISWRCMHYCRAFTHASAILIISLDNRVGEASEPQRVGTTTSGFCGYFQSSSEWCKSRHFWTIVLNFSIFHSDEFLLIFLSAKEITKVIQNSWFFFFISQVKPWFICETREEGKIS